MTQEEDLSRPSRSSLWICIGLPALLMTVTGVMTAWVVFVAHPMERALYSDMANYAAIARDIMAGRFDLTHFFQPIGFPLWMAFWRTLGGGDWWLLKLSHVVLVTLSVFLGWRAARHILGADSGALNFVEGKCRHKENRDSRGHVWLSPLFVYLGETDVRRWDEPFSNQPFFWKEGLKCIRANPAVMITSTRYIYYLFGGNPLWPVQAWRAKTTELIYERGLLYVVAPLSLLGLIAAVRRWDQPEMAAALLVLSLVLMVYVFKSELRYRVPFDAATMILATLGARQVTLKARSAWKGLR